MILFPQDQGTKKAPEPVTQGGRRSFHPNREDDHKIQKRISDKDRKLKTGPIK